jgi:DNA-binding response OmpR family regulator
MPNRGGGELTERLNVRRDIEKPFSPNELAAKIRTVLGKRGRAAARAARAEADS